MRFASRTRVTLILLGPVLTAAVARLAVNPLAHPLWHRVGDVAALAVALGARSAGLVVGLLDAHDVTANRQPLPTGRLTRTATPDATSSARSPRMTPSGVR